MVGFFVRVTCLLVPLLACLMFWRDRAVPKKIARWMNRLSEKGRGFVAGHRYPPGMMIYKSIAAVVFIFSPGFDRDFATLRSCSGWVEHVLYYPGAGEYQFFLGCPFAKGSAWVELRDAKKQVVLRLDQTSGRGRAELSAEGGYVLHWEFMDASGKCELGWQPVNNK